VKIVWPMTILLIVLTGCNTVPYSGDIPSIIKVYEQKIDFAQAGISYAQCLNEVQIPEAPMLDPENESLQELIPIIRRFVLEDTTVLEKTIAGEGTNGKTSDIEVTFPSFLTFIDESRDLLGYLDRRLSLGQMSLTKNSADDQTIEKLYEHDRPGSYYGPIFGVAEGLKASHYVITSSFPRYDVSKVAVAISKTALQASYFSDELDYEAIYNCSMIGGKYDSRFNDAGSLAFEDARNAVDFSAMSVEDRKISNRDKREEMYQRYDDAKDTVRALKKLF